MDEHLGIIVLDVGVFRACVERGRLRTCGRGVRHKMRTAVLCPECKHPTTWDYEQPSTLVTCTACSAVCPAEQWLVGPKAAIGDPLLGLVNREDPMYARLLQVAVARHWPSETVARIWDLHCQQPQPVAARTSGTYWEALYHKVMNPGLDLGE